MMKHFFKFLVINIIIFYVLRFGGLLISFTNGLYNGSYLLSPYMEIALGIQLFILLLMFLDCYKKNEKRKYLNHSF